MAFSQWLFGPQRVNKCIIMFSKTYQKIVESLFFVFFLNHKFEKIYDFCAFFGQKRVKKGNQISDFPYSFTCFFAGDYFYQKTCYFCGIFCVKYITFCHVFHDFLLIFVFFINFFVTHFIRILSRPIIH